MLITCGIYLYSTRMKKLLVCHATNSPWKSWSIPKGLKDEGEDIYAAAARELYEETGVGIEKLHVLQKHTLPPVNYRKQKKILKSFLVITNTDLENFPLECISLTGKLFPEVDSWKWIAPEKMTSWLHESQIANYELIKKLIAWF